jgi:hypothetical protein
MSLTIHNDLEQGTEEWLAARRGMVTASVVGQLLTATGRPASNDTSRRLTLALVAERLTGETEPVYMNDDMLRGHLEEPIARDMYAEHFSGGEIVSEVGFMVRDDWGFSLGYSPDGLVGDNGLIEVKAPRAKGHIATILSGVVPDRHMPQIQAGLLVSGRDWCDFISYYGGLPPFVKRVHADPKWAESIVDALLSFEKDAHEMTDRYDLATRGLPATERRIPLETNTVELNIA